MLGQFFIFRLRLLAFALGRGLGGARIGQQLLGRLLARGNDVRYRAEQEMRQEPDQDGSVDRLQGQRPPIDLHGRTRSLTDEGIRKQHKKGDDFIADAGGLDMVFK